MSRQYIELPLNVSQGVRRRKHGSSDRVASARRTRHHLFRRIVLAVALLIMLAFAAIYGLVHANKGLAEDGADPQGCSSGSAQSPAEGQVHRPPHRSLRNEVAKIVEALHKPVMICEAGYPAVANFTGQFAEWNQPTDGYPLSDEGQAKWIHDLAATVWDDKKFAGVFYWSPEWYDGELWDAFALFNREGKARPGVRAFRPRID